MTSCAVMWCSKNSRNSNYKINGITFHRFPKDPSTKGKWIEATKKENWFPSNFSVICSRHFTEDCFQAEKSRRRLLNTAIPTLHLPLVSGQFNSEDIKPKMEKDYLDYMDNDDFQSDEDFDCRDDVKPIDLMKESDSTVTELKPTSSCQPIAPIANTMKRKVIETVSQYETAENKRLYRRVLELTGIVKQKNKKLKLLRDKLRYSGQKIACLNAIIDKLEKKSNVKE